MRGGRRHFTHSKVMAWVAFDRGIKAVEQFGSRRRPSTAGRRRATRSTREVCEKGFDPELNSFVQSYGSTHLDASLLMIPLVGFLPADDPRVRGTVEAIERDLIDDGFVRRYNSDAAVDGLPPGEGAFLPCTFWLADNLALRVAATRPASCSSGCSPPQRRRPAGRGSTTLAKRQLGNFPQAFSHVGLVNTAAEPHPGSSGCPSERRHKER